MVESQESEFEPSASLVLKFCDRGTESGRILHRIGLRSHLDVSLYCVVQRICKMTKCWFYFAENHNKQVKKWLFYHIVCFRKCECRVRVQHYVLYLAYLGLDTNFSIIPPEFDTVCTITLPILSSWPNDRRNPHIPWPWSDGHKHLLCPNLRMPNLAPLLYTLHTLCLQKCRRGGIIIVILCTCGVSAVS